MASNVVMISVDDLFNVSKFRDVFGVEIQTPNMDRLAAMGITFENAYASVALCNPSRTSIMTGQTPSDTGVHNNNQPWGEHISPADTIISMIRGSGYETAGFGKVMHRLSEWQATALFDHSSHGADAQTIADVTAYLTNPPAGDFMLSVGLHDPHKPFTTPQEFLDLYPLADIVVPPNIGDEISPYIQAFLGDGYREGSLKQTIQHYLANVSEMDAKLGTILDAIEASGTNPAIVFFSDHGFSLGDHDGYVGKFNLWEQAANSPLIVVQPGGAHGVVVDTPVSFLDIAPTVLALAGLEPTAAMSGQSLLGTIQERPVLTEMLGSYSIRVDDWRYSKYVDGTVEVFNIATDPGCYDNLHGEPAAASVEGVLAVTLSSLLADENIVQVSGLTIHEGAGGATEYYVQSQAALAAAPLDTGGHDIIFALTDNIVMAPGIEDYLRAWKFPGHVFTVAGNDAANHIQGANVARGGKGMDTIIGGSELHGGRSHDLLIGGLGNNRLFGDSSSDTLQGGSGHDTLVGGVGNDKLTGGAHADRFMFNAASGKDTIRDYTNGKDHIVIAGVLPADITITDVNVDAVISYGANTIKVVGAAGLTLDDLDFG